MPASTRLIPLSLAIALGAVVALPAYAQQDYGNLGSTSMRAQREKRRAELKGEKEDKAAEQTVEQAPLYPNATRQSPEAKAKGSALKDLQALQEQYEKDDKAGVLAKADAILANGASGAYEKAFAAQLAGSAAAELDDQARAESYFAKAIEADGLDNNSHFQTMYNLAVVQYGEQKYPQALATMDRFLAETKSDNAEHQAFRAGILANMGRNDEAGAIYKTLLAKNPDDTRLMMNAVAALQQADQFDQAVTILADANQRGLLKDGKQLRALYVGYMNANKDKEALAVIRDGQAKGLLTPGPELGRDYAVLAQRAYAANDVNGAIELYKQAAPMYPDGEAYLNLAKVYSIEGRPADAKAAAQQALDKGVKKPDEARQLIGK